MVGADAAVEVADVACDRLCDHPTLLLLLLLPAAAADELDTPGPLVNDACWVWVAEDVTCALVVAGRAADTLPPDVADVAWDALGCPPTLLLLLVELAP